MPGERTDGSDDGGSGSFFRVDLDGVPRTSWGLVAVVLALVTAFNLLFNLLVFSSEAVRSAVFVPVVTATWGLVRPTLLVNLVMFAVVVVGVLFRGAGLVPRDVGLDRRTVGRGAAVTALVWAGVELVGAATALATTGTVAVAGPWVSAGAGVVVGAFLAQALGNALFEEVVYRGFLLTQAYRLLDRRVGDPRVRLATALVGSQAAFALLHLPNRVYQGTPLAALPGNLALVLVSGLLFALVYYRTGNLVVAVGVHALGNAPLSVFVPGQFASWLVNPAMVVLILAWPPIDRGLSAVERTVRGRG